MSTIGANVQWMPTARASRAATACPRAMVSGSQDAAIAIGTGSTVRRPWMTSNPKSTGMPWRLPSTASRCRRLTSAGSVTNSKDPAPPRASASSTSPGFCRDGPTVASGAPNEKYWVSCPAFSAGVIDAINSSTRVRIAAASGSSRCWGSVTVRLQGHAPTSWRSRSFSPSARLPHLEAAIFVCPGSSGA
jgi:hypothetical protein